MCERMVITMSAILDIAVIAILLLTIYNSWRKGLARSVIELAGYIATLFAAYAFSNPLGSWIYDTFMRPAVDGAVTDYIANSISSSSSQAVSSSVSQANINSFVSAIPDSLRGLLSQYHIGIDSVTTAASGALTQSSHAVAQQVVAKIIEPIAFQLAHSIAFALIFFVGLVVVRFIARAVGGVFRLPVLRTVDRVGGGVIGIAKGVLLVFIFATVVAVIIPLTSLQKKPPVTQANVDNTIVFKQFYNNNPVTQVLLNK